MKRHAILISVTLIMVGFMVPHMVTADFIPPQGATPTPGTGGLNLSSLLNSGGLNGGTAQQCVAGDTLQSVNINVDRLVSAPQATLANLMVSTLNKVLSQLATCALNAIPIFGNATPKCTITLASDFEAALVQNGILQKQNFLGRCTAAAEMHDIGNTVNQILSDQGPNGGTVAVTNWVNDLSTEPDRQAMRRMWTILVNTDICPYFRDDVYTYFGVPQSYIDNPPSITSTDLNTSAEDPFQLSASCTVPQSYVPGSESDAASFAAEGGFQFLDELSKPQNNYEGFIGLAETELQKQRSAVSQAAVSEAVSGGGFRSVYGSGASGCQVMDPNGQCIQPARVRQPPAAAEQLSNTKFEGPLLWLTSQNGTDQKAIQDMSQVFTNSALDSANAPLPFKIEFGLDDNPQYFTPPPTPTPSPIPSNYPTDPACSGTVPGCSCVEGDQPTQSAITAGVSAAMKQLMAQHPELFSPAGSSVIAKGVTNLQVAQALCDVINAGAANSCKPRPGVATQIVVLGAGQTISVDVITPDGALRTNGGIAIAACEPGIQD